MTENDIIQKLISALKSTRKLNLHQYEINTVGNMVYIDIENALKEADNFIPEPSETEKLKNLISEALDETYKESDDPGQIIYDIRRILSKKI